MAFHSSRVSLLAGAAALALCAAPQLATAAADAGMQAAPHKAAHLATDRSLSVLFDQTSNYMGYGRTSTLFTDDSHDSTAIADDFVVPEGQTWIVKEIDVTGTYINGFGPSTQTVTFFKDKAHTVGNTVAEFDNENGAGDGEGSFAITLGDKGVKLKSGHYWVSVVANMAFETGGEWEWGFQGLNTTEGDPVMFESPGNSTCPTWGPIYTCFGEQDQGGGQMFTLKGRVK